MFFRFRAPVLALLFAAAAAGCVHSNAPVETPPSAAPVYPGAKAESSGASATALGGPSGTAFSTADSFDTVLAWYEKNLPPGSERVRVSSPVPSALFSVGDGRGRISVTITPSPLCCRTFILIAVSKG